MEVLKSKFTHGSREPAAPAFSSPFLAQSFNKPLALLASPQAHPSKLGPSKCTVEFWEPCPDQTKIARVSFSVSFHGNAQVTTGCHWDIPTIAPQWPVGVKSSQGWFNHALYGSVDPKNWAWESAAGACFLVCPEMEKIPILMEKTMCETSGWKGTLFSDDTCRRVISFNSCNTHKTAWICLQAVSDIWCEPSPQYPETRANLNFMAILVPLTFRLT